MPDHDSSELGPIDYLVLEFPAGRLNVSGAMAAELVTLADAGVIRILDLVVVAKGTDGATDAMEMEDVEGLERLRPLETEIAEILAEDDVLALAASLSPGTEGAVIVWENAWAAPFADAIRRAGGQFVASGRIPVEAIAASMDAELGQGA